LSGGSLLDRRRFLTTGSGLAAALALPRHLLRELERVPSELPDAALHGRDPDAYWAAIRKKFVIPQDEIYLNNGTVGSSPLPVLKAVFDGYNTLEQMADADPEDYPIWGYGPWNQFRDPLADFVGCKRDEIALVRNSTEANSYMANGIDMKPGDEVLMTDQEHPGGEHPWNLKAKRYGIVVKKVALPKPVKDGAQVVNLFNDAITDRTRVMFFSHITTATGVVLPAKDLCALARSKGILSVVDGAHVAGMMHLNVSDIGCDAYSSSPHKWLQAPKGVGFLYVRDDVIDRIWNTIVTEGWDDPKIRAERFQRIGSSNVPSLWGLAAAIKFANEIGMEKIESRHRALADYMLAEMVKRGAESWTSPDAALRCAIVTVNVPPVQRKDLENWMWQKHKIRIRGGEPSKLRLSTPYYLQRAEIDRFLEKYDQFKRGSLA
jgi:selenocysteine lyase/cysteine desulfurase